MSEEIQESPVGSVYLLCLGEGISRGSQKGHARHYIGWTTDVERRVKEHKSGGADANPLVRAVVERGGTVELARVWPNVTKKFERWVKNQKHTPRHCPRCTPNSKGVILGIEPVDQRG